MQDQYKNISVAYQQARRMPMTYFLEVPSVIRQVGDLSNRTLIDFACGEGFFTRMFRNLGASTVIGTDLSPDMIRLAQQQEASSPLGITYAVADASILHRFGQFDLATAIYLFNYADDEATLANMLANVRQNLVPGGRLIAVIPNPDFINGRADTLPYGYFMEERARRPQNSRVRMTFTGENPFSIEFTQWNRPTWERLLARNGFTDINWIPFTVSDEGIRQFGPDFWTTTLQNPKSLILSAIRTN